MWCGGVLPCTKQICWSQSGTPFQEVESPTETWRHRRRNWVAISRTPGHRPESLIFLLRPSSLDWIVSHERKSMSGIEILNMTMQIPSFWVPTCCTFRNLFWIQCKWITYQLFLQSGKSTVQVSYYLLKIECFRKTREKSENRPSTIRWRAKEVSCSAETSFKC